MSCFELTELWGTSITPDHNCISSAVYLFFLFSQPSESEWKLLVACNFNPHETTTSNTPPHPLTFFLSWQDKGRWFCLSQKPFVAATNLSSSVPSSSPVKYFIMWTAHVLLLCLLGAALFTSVTCSSENSFCSFSHDVLVTYITRFPWWRGKPERVNSKGNNSHNTLLFFLSFRIQWAWWLLLHILPEKSEQKVHCVILSDGSPLPQSCTHVSAENWLYFTHQMMT